MFISTFKFKKACSNIAAEGCIILTKRPMPWGDIPLMYTLLPIHSQYKNNAVVSLRIRKLSDKFIGADLYASSCKHKTSVLVGDGGQGVTR